MQRIDGHDWDWVQRADDPRYWDVTRDGEVGNVRVMAPDGDGTARGFYGSHTVNTPDDLEGAQAALLALVLERGWIRSRT